MSTTAESPPAVYSEADMQTLQGCEHIRVNPAMYIGNTDTGGLHVLVNELLVTALAEWHHGECTRIDVALKRDGSCSLRDDGRGFSLRALPTGISEVEALFSMWGACGRSQSKDWRSIYGMVANALSDLLAVEVRSNGRRHGFRASRGVITARLADLGPTGERGNTVTFHPDPEIFGSAGFSVARIADRLMELAYLHAGLRLSLTTETTEGGEEFFASGGLADYVHWLNCGETPLRQVIHFRRAFDEIEIDAAVQWIDSDGAGTRLCYMNGEFAPHGGTPLDGLHLGIKKALMRFQDHLDPTKALKKFETSDLHDGLTAMVSVRHPDPQWLGATKSQIGNPGLEKLVAGVTAAELARRFVADTDFGQRVWDRCALQERARSEARKARRALRRPHPPAPSP